MKQIRTKSGIQVYILQTIELCPEGAICFYEDEYEHAKRISDGYVHDPEMQRDFWKNIFERKKEPNYSVFHDFQEELRGSPDPTYSNAPSVLNNALPSTDATPKPNFKGAEICLSVIEKLKGNGAKTMEDKRKEFETCNTPTEI